MKIKVILIIMVLCFVACNKGKDKDIDIKIPEKTMALIIQDMAKADKMVNMSKEDSTKKDKMRRDYKQSILKHYNVSEKDYETSLRLYLNNRDKMDKVLNQAEK
jgi:site-specific DNA-adenine methylase